MSARSGPCAKSIVTKCSAENANAIYELNVPELESILKNPEIKDMKVVLISIAGAFRKGKSFLLNLFVSYLEWLTDGKQGEWLHADTPMDKFEYRAGTAAHTNGITIWNKPYILNGANGEKYAIFLMDTQGTFDHGSSVKDCTCIFAMSTLLSSVQIFNLFQQIQADDLNNLQLFVEYAQLARNGSNTPFQKLLFLIRDWANPKEFAYGLRGGKKYLQDILKRRNNLPEENRTVHESLQACFEELDAFLMPHPGSAVAIGNSKIVLGKIRESFEKHLKQFIPHLFISENLVVKKINGHAITCEELCELFKKYMEIFNNGQLPEPKAIFEATAETVNNLAEQAAKDAYDVMMAEAMDVNPDLCDIPILDDSQKFAMEVARERFEARPKMGEFSVQRHLENLEKYFDHHYEMFKKTVLQNINSFIQSVNYNEERQEMLDTLEAQLRRQADLEQSETNKQLILEGLKAITTLGMVALSLRAGAIP